MPEAFVNLKAVRVAETERRSSAVRAPYMVEMVADVERKLFDVTSPERVTGPLRVEMVADVERKLFDVTSPERVNVPPMVPSVDEVDLKLFDIS